MNTILIIDDDEVELIILSRLLTLGNYAKDLKQFNSAIIALEYLTNSIDFPEKWPTHIFVDINMPLMNGFEFVDTFIKSFPQFDSKIFLLSSSIDWKDKKKADEHPLITGFLTKPFTLETAECIFT